MTSDLDRLRAAAADSTADDRAPVIVIGGPYDETVTVRGFDPFTVTRVVVTISYRGETVTDYFDVDDGEDYPRLLEELLQAAERSADDTAGNIRGEWCTDCMMLSANGEVGGDDAYWSNIGALENYGNSYRVATRSEYAANSRGNGPGPAWLADDDADEWTRPGDVDMTPPDDAATYHDARMNEQWPADEWHLAGTGDGEPSFSWSPCDGCGSTLGGDREPFVAMPRK